MFSRLLTYLLIFGFISGCAASTIADTPSDSEKTVSEAKKELTVTTGDDLKYKAMFKGWAALKRQKLDPSAAEDDWIFMSGISTDNIGQVTKILDEGKETGYSVQLVVLTYANTETTILKLGLVEDATNKTITYIWGEPNAKRLGMNLRWFQVGLTKDEAAE